MARLPQPGGDSGNWGEILNDYLSQVHKGDGTLKDSSITQTHLSSEVVNDLTKARHTSASAYAKAGSSGVPLSLDSGQAVTVFGNAPITQNAGRYTHVPYAGVNSAGYMQAELSDEVIGIGCEAVFHAGVNSGQIALVIPSDYWANGHLVEAGVHFVMNTSGWHLDVWTGSSIVTLASGTFSVRLANDVPHSVKIELNKMKQTAYIILPDGNFASAKDARIATRTSRWAVWELYETDGTTLVPASLNKVWASDAVNEYMQAGSIADVVSAATFVGNQPSSSSGIVYVDHTPASAVTSQPTGTRTEVLAGALQVTFVASSSGKVMLELSGSVSVASGSILYWGGWLGAAGTTNVGTAQVVTGPYTGIVTAKIPVNGLTANTSYTIRWWHQLSGAAGSITQYMDAGLARRAQMIIHHVN